MMLEVETNPYTCSAEAMEAPLRRMLGMSNSLYEGMRNGKDEKFMEQSIDQLLEFAQRQFACEEELQRHEHYDGLPAHQFEHENLVEWLKQMRVHLIAGTLPSPPLEIAEYLRDWLYEHVLRSDQAFLSEVGAHERW